MVPRRDEQRLGSRETATGSWTRPLGLDGAADRGGDRCGPRDGSRLPAGRRDPGARPRAARRTGGKTGHFREVSTDSPPAKPAICAGGVHRRGEPGAHARAERQRLRAVSRADRRGARARAQRGRDLAGPGRRPRLHRAVRERPSLRREAARRRRRPRRASSSRPRPAKKARSTTARGRWSATRRTGKYRRTRLFVLTLGYSRKSVRLLVWRSSAQIWAELHERAFRRLGGTVRVIVLDNLREGVLTPDIYDPTLNPLYRDVLAHYGVVALPCRVGDPDRKGKVEAGVGHAQKTPLQGPALRDARGGAGVPGSLGDALGRHAHPRHDEATSRRDVCRGAAGARPAAARTVSLLPLRRAHRAPRWLRRSRGRVLRRAARLDRAARPGAVERLCTSACSRRRPASCCASICARRAAGIASTTTIDPRARRRAPLALLARATTAGPHISAVCDVHPSARRRRRRPPHPRRARARQEARPGRRRRRRQGGARSRRADLSLSPPVSRTPPAGAR